MNCGDSCCVSMTGFWRIDNIPWVGEPRDSNVSLIIFRSANSGVAEELGVHWASEQFYRCVSFGTTRSKQRMLQSY